MKQCDERYPRNYGDDLLSTDKRLRFKWRWSRSASQFSREELKKWTHFQVSECILPDNLWKLEAVLWHSGGSVVYEARVNYGSNRIASKEKFKTRLDAQIGAEKLFEDWVTCEFKKMVKNKKESVK